MFLIALVARVVLSCGASSAPQTDPSAILADATRALQNTAELACRAAFFGIEGFKDTAWRMRASVAIQFVRGQTFPRCRAEIQTPGSDLIADSLYRVICDGREICWVEHATRTAIVGSVTDRQVNPKLGMLDPMGFFLVLNETAPFAEAARHELKYEGRRDVQGVACDVVHITYDAKQGSARRWYLGADDHLPRRAEEFSRWGDIVGGTVMELTDVEVDPGLEAGTFAMAGPASYELRRCGQLASLRFSHLPGWLACEFRYADARDPYLTRLRGEQDLDAIVQSCASDLERVRALCTWTHERWQHKSDGRPQSDDAISILAEAKAGGRFRCVEYATVLRAYLQAEGIPARMVNLLPRDIETRYGGAGHMIVEAFLRDQRAWLFADPQFGAVAAVDGKPASAVELQLGLATGATVDFGERLGGSPEEYRRFVGERLFYFRVWIDQNPGGSNQNRDRAQWMLVPVGAPEPRVFERTLRIDGCRYTHSLESFYAPPI